MTLFIRIEPHCGFPAITTKVRKGLSPTREAELTARKYLLDRGYSWRVLESDNIVSAMIEPHLGVECALCGSDQPATHVLDAMRSAPRWFWNRREEVFCCRSHRDRSNSMLKRFMEKEG